MLNDAATAGPFLPAKLNASAAPRASWPGYVPRHCAALPTWATGDQALDAALGGGWPRGTLIEWLVDQEADAQTLYAASELASHSVPPVYWVSEVKEISEAREVNAQPAPLDEFTLTEQETQEKEKTAKEFTLAAGQGITVPKVSARALPHWPHTQLFVPKTPRDACWQFEQALMQGGVVIGYLPLSTADSGYRLQRRLQSLAQRYGGTAIVLRPSEQRQAASSAGLRLLVQHADDDLLLTVLRRDGRPVLDSQPMPFLSSTTCCMDHYPVLSRQRTVSFEQKLAINLQIKFAARCKLRLMSYGRHLGRIKSRVAARLTTALPHPAL